MKLKIASLFAALATIGVSHGAITLSSATFTSPTAGLVLTDSSNDLLAIGTAFWQAGTFTTGFDFNQEASLILGGFSSVSSIGNLGPFAGVFNSSVSYDGGTTAAPAGIVGSDIYILVGNAADIASSTLVAVFNTGSQFIGGDVAGNGAISATADSLGKVVYGITGGAPNAQPNPAFTLSQSVQLTSVPEPSAALLGAFGVLGLLRRRRA